MNGSGRQSVTTLESGPLGRKYLMSLNLESVAAAPALAVTRNEIEEEPNLGPTL
jgi:hypothetical protein